MCVLTSSNLASNLYDTTGVKIHTVISFSLSGLILGVQLVLTLSVYAAYVEASCNKTMEFVYYFFAKRYGPERNCHIPMPLLISLIYNRVNGIFDFLYITYMYGRTSS